jgi:DNA-binding transcriptional MerR regulator
MARHLIVRSRKDEPIYTRSVAAELARISEEFLRACEQERLIRARVMTGGGQGYSAADIRRLARIRRLREDLELDLPAVEVVLHMRRRVLDLLQEMDEMERYMRRREQALLAEIQQLRRHLAQEADWQS